MNISKVLIPTDFSKESEKAFSAVKIFMELFNCKADLIHVVPMSAYLNESITNLGLPLDMSKDVYPKIVEASKKKLKEISEKYLNPDSIGELIIEIDRKASSSILSHAKEGDYDMIIMSARGGHSTDFLHGSTTEKVVRNSSIPVLALSNEFHYDKIKTIIVPTDISDFSFEVIPIAFEIANSFNASLSFLNIVELYNSGLYMETAEPQNASGYINSFKKEKLYSGLMDRLESFFKESRMNEFSIKRHEEPYLDEIVKTSGGKSVSIPIRTIIKKGMVAHRDIIYYANEHADMVIMSTHGRTGLSRFFLGSTVEQITRNLEAPLLTLKPETKE
jgi:nucleotide-binding universal stress UspA family protein